MSLFAKDALCCIPFLSVVKYHLSLLEAIVVVFHSSTLSNQEAHSVSVLARSGRARHSSEGMFERVACRYLGFGLPSIDPVCVALHAFLRFHKFDYETVDCNNEAMSPSGLVPVYHACESI